MALRLRKYQDDINVNYQTIETNTKNFPCFIIWDKQHQFFFSPERSFLTGENKVLITHFDLPTDIIEIDNVIVCFFIGIDLIGMPIYTNDFVYKEVNLGSTLDNPYLNEAKDDELEEEYKLILENANIANPEINLKEKI